MTPGYSAPSAAPVEESAQPTPTPGAEPQPTPTPSAEPTAAPEPSTTPSAGDGPEGTGGGDSAGEGADLRWVPGLLLAAVLLAALVRWGVRLRRRRVLEGPDTNRAVLAAYRELLRLAPWGGREDPEVTRLAQKARFSPHVLTGAERRTALERLRREARRTAEALPAWKRLLFRLFRGRW